MFELELVFVEETLVKRRDFLRLSSATLATACGATVVGGRVATAVPGPPASRRAPDVVLSLRARQAKVRILPGGKTSVWSYAGKVKTGGSSVLSQIPGSYLGPIIRVRQGQRIRVEFKNRIPEQTIVHWHGLHVPAAMDGHPQFAIGQGGKYVYEFDIVNRAGTYWYHPHPHGLTGKQAYFGLAGLFIVSDDEEDALGLPVDDQDIPIVIQDRRFDADNQLVYGIFGAGPGGGGGGDMAGFTGNEILVNGIHEPKLDVTAEPHRLRLLNGSNTRIYKLGWNDGTRLDVIGSDGGLLRRPVKRDFVTLAPGERVDLWVDFSRWPAGSEIALESRQFDAGMSGFGPMALDGDHDEDLPMGAAFDILTVRVNAGDGGGALPARLSRIKKLKLSDAFNADSPKELEFSGRFGTWTINGRTFELTGVAAEEAVQRGSMHVLDLVNPGTGGAPGGGMMMRMPHPVHLHGQQFQVVSRSIESGFQSPWRTLEKGYVDAGWKDTVLLMPGERVRVLKRFEDHTGLFLYHCHNLEHEDRGMMRNFEVTA